MCVCARTHVHVHACALACIYSQLRVVFFSLPFPLILTLCLDFHNVIGRSKGPSSSVNELQPFTGPRKVTRDFLLYRLLIVFHFLTKSLFSHLFFGLYPLLTAFPPCCIRNICNLAYNVTVRAP